MRFKCIKSGVRFIALIAALILVGYWPATAQNTASSVKGLVESTFGRPIPGASVLIKNNQTNFVAGTDTDSAGVFSFTNVPAGQSYSFTFSSVGFQDQTLSGYTIQ